MTLKEGIEFRDKYKPVVIGKTFIDAYGNNFDKAVITDVIVCPKEYITKVVMKMQEANMSNEAALLFFTNDNDEMDVFIISYHSMGDGNLYHASLKFQLQRMNILPPDLNQ